MPFITPQTAVMDGLSRGHTLDVANIRAKALRDINTAARSAATLEQLQSLIDAILHETAARLVQANERLALAHRHLNNDECVSAGINPCGK